MGLTKYKIGELIEIVDERNNLGIRDFFGININKEFMPTVANTEGLDETKYKVVRKNRFVYSGMQTGRDECIRVSMYNKDVPILVSPAYTTFEVVATDIVNPLYFFMKFLSKEKDRYGAFCSDGSIRSNLDWDVFCDIELELPPLSIQQNYVDIYNAMLENQKSYLIAENFEVVCATDGQKACEAFDIGSYSIVLLDLMIPKITGMNVMKYIRQKSTVPIIIISAKDSDSDKTLGLGLGADDYITKPFSITEVMARIKANIRRNTEYAAVQPEQTKLVWGPLVMNLENHTVTKSGEIIELTAKEFDILRLLLENPQKVYTKAQIYSLIWNDAYMGDENAVNVHISRLRTKIEDDPRKPQVVITVWGIGYKLGEQK